MSLENPVGMDGIAETYFPRSPALWTNKKTQDAYIAGGATAVMAMLLLALLACCFYTCFRFWSNSNEENRELRRKLREQQLIDCERQNGNKYMRLYNESQDEINQDSVSSTQTFFFPK